MGKLSLITFGIHDQSLSPIQYIAMAHAQIYILAIGCFTFALTTFYFANSPQGSRINQEESQKYNKSVQFNTFTKDAEFHKFINEYISYHQSVTSNVTLALQAKYIVIDPSYDGWGNRFNTMITTLLAAMVSGRIWLIRPEKHPVFSFFDLAVDASWTKIRAQFNRTTQGRKILNNSVKLKEGDRTTKRFLAENLDTITNQVVFFSGLDYQVPLLQRNPHYKDQIRKLFPDGVIYHRLFHSFFKLKPFLAEKIETKSKELFRAYTLGIQVRTKKLKIDTEQFCHIANAVLTSKSAVPETTSVFVATDGRERVWDMLADCLCPFNITYIPDTTGVTKGKNPGSEEGALIDLFLLAKCDDLIITHSSSFGPTAAGIANVIPYSSTVPVDCNTTSYQPILFYKPLNTEPCMYYCNKIVTKFEEPYPYLFMADGLWIQYCQCHRYKLKD